ncbi:MAG: hypothetical protein ACL93V_11120 [Candidatus Electrothrix sp. YB6]
MPAYSSPRATEKNTIKTGDRCDAAEVRKWLAAGCLLFIAANILRSWAAVSSIGFHMEDSMLFSRYYGNVVPITDVGRTLFGQPYKMLITNLTAWLFAHFDVRIQPYLYLGTGFLWGTCAACCFFASGLIRSRTVLLVGPLLMGLVGLNHIYYYTTLVFIMYTCLAVLLALFFYPAPKSVFSTLLFIIACLCLPWAGPYSVVVLPASLLFLVLFRHELDRKKQWPLVLAAGSSFIYYLSVQGGTSNIMGITNKKIVTAYFASLLDRIIFFDLFKSVSPWYWLVFLAVVGGSFFLFRKDAVFIKHSLVMLAIIFGSYALFYLSSKYPMYNFPKPCHIFLSLFFWCIYLLYFADHLFQVYGEKKQAAVLFCLLVCLLIIVDNKNFPYKRKIRYPLPDTGAFIAAIHTMEQRGFEEKNQYVILRQYSFPYRLFRPWVQVGSRRPDAQQLLRSDLPPALQNAFVSSTKERRPEVEKID